MLPATTTAFVTPTNMFLEKGAVQHWQHEIGDNGAVDLHDLDFSTHQEGSGSGSTVVSCVYSKQNGKKDLRLVSQGAVVFIIAGYCFF